MRPGPSAAVRLVNTIVEIDSPPQTVTSVLTLICVQEQWCASVDEASELAERWKERAQTLLQNEYNELIALGRPTRVEFNSSSPYMLQGPCFIEPNDSEGLRGAKSRRSHMNAYSSALTTLSPRQFELLCSRILFLIGVENPVTTKYSADEGIDFYGRLRLSSSLLPLSQLSSWHAQLSIWLIGQAKHYDKERTISTFHIRELVGSVELAKAKVFGSVGDKYGDLGIRVCDPIFYLFFTTAPISSDSWRLLVRSGVIAMDGEMLAAFLADHDVAMDRGVLNPGELRAWIEASV